MTNASVSNPACCQSLLTQRTLSSIWEVCVPPRCGLLQSPVPWLPSWDSLAWALCSFVCSGKVKRKHTLIVNWDECSCQGHGYRPCQPTFVCPSSGTVNKLSTSCSCITHGCVLKPERLVSHVHKLKVLAATGPGSSPGLQPSLAFCPLSFPSQLSESARFCLDKNAASVEKITAFLINQIFPEHKTDIT